MTKDIELLKDWLMRQEKFPECLRPQDLENCRQTRLEWLSGSPSLSMLREGESFLAWRTDAYELDTGLALASLWAKSAELEDFRLLLTRSMELFPEHRLFLELRHEDESSKELLTDLAFSKQRHILTRVPQHHNLETLRQGRFQLRVGAETDRMILCSLAAAHILHTLPPGRQADVARYTQSIIERFQTLDYGPESNFDLLIAEEKESFQAVGYILLESLSEDTISLLDIAVRQSHWGHYVAQFLVRATENILMDCNIGLIVTEISAANRRSLLTARRSLKFQPQLEQWYSPSNAPVES